MNYCMYLYFYINIFIREIINVINCDKNNGECRDKLYFINMTVPNISNLVCFIQLFWYRY